MSTGNGGGGKAAVEWLPTQSGQCTDSPLITLSCVVPDHADISAIGANNVSGSPSQRRQRRRMQYARKNDIQNERVGGKPCHPNANHPFARCVLHSGFPSAKLTSVGTRSKGEAETPPRRNSVAASRDYANNFISTCLVYLYIDGLDHWPPDRSAHQRARQSARQAHFGRGRRRSHAYAGTLRVPFALFARVCCADVTVAPRELWYLSNSSGPHASRDLLVLTVFVTWVSQGDHGMNRCLRSLPCLFTLS